MPVNCGKQRELLTGVATGEWRLGLSDPAWVEANDVEMRDDFIRELSPRNVGGRALHRSRPDRRDSRIE